MKRLTIFFLFLLFFYSCGNNDTQDNTPASENDVDAARNFIQSALSGDYRKARTFVLPDSVNYQYLDAFENNYKNRMTNQDKAGYSIASINIHNVKTVNDSTSIINYSNSYKQQDDSLKVVKSNGQWLVDLKYSFSQPNDTLK